MENQSSRLLPTQLDIIESFSSYHMGGSNMSWHVFRRDTSIQNWRLIYQYQCPTEEDVKKKVRYLLTEFNDKVSDIIVIKGEVLSLHKEEKRTGKSELWV